MNKLIYLLAIVAVLSSPAHAQSSLGKLLQDVVNKETSDTARQEGKKKYEEVITKNAITVRGVVDIHKVKSAYYMEIPFSLLEKPMLLTGRVSEISSNREIIAGEMPSNPWMVEWDADEEKVYLLDADNRSIVDPREAIAKGFRRNNLKPVMKVFPIRAVNRDSTAAVIDVSKFFCGEEKHLSPFTPATPFDALFGISRLKGTFKADMSSILDFKSFPTNFTFRTRMVYSVLESPFTAIMTSSMILLPDTPMKPRLRDHRLGFFADSKQRYSEDKDRVESLAYVNRWNLMPAPGEMERYKRGEMVVPEKQIVYYVDNAFPAKWRPWLKEGIEDWQEAFEQIGFKDAIVARDYPVDEDFDPEDIRHSCLIYASVPTANAMGPSWTDPRSGEIINASVYFYHNVLKLLHNWRFVQTAPVDPAARAEVYDMEVMGPLLRYLVAHEIGHTLGLMHNMRGSYAYPVDSLRSRSFTDKYGTTASIMDYARYNYVAQPGDGVTWLLPPRLGLYDMFAIRWAYQPIFEAATPEEEKPVLNRWIIEKGNDPLYRYGAQEILTSMDPAASSEALGDDAIKASGYGLENLKILTRHLVEWTARPGDDFSYTQEMWKEVISQFKRYMGHVEKYIGGNFLEYPVHGDGKTSAFMAVPKAKQREALAYIIRSLKEFPGWILDPKVITMFDPENDAVNDLLVDYVRSLTSGSLLGKIGFTAKTSHDPYTQEEYLDDLYDLLFENSVKGNDLTWGERNMQYAFLHTVFDALNFHQPEVTAAPRRFADLSSLYYDMTPRALANQASLLPGDGLTASTRESDLKINARKLYYAQVLKMQKLFQRQAKSSRGDLKEHYTYLLFEIDNALGKAR
jgi:hypothetical protein